jgi:hypothetical protein
MSEAQSRRSLLKGLALGLGACAAGRAKNARAANDLPHLAESDPAAAKLGYVLEASHVDVKKHPNYVAGSNCDNCLLLLGTPGDTYRPCRLFPGKLVKISGWCVQWTAEM